MKDRAKISLQFPPTFYAIFLCSTFSSLLIVVKGKLCELPGKYCCEYGHTVYSYHSICSRCCDTPSVPENSDSPYSTGSIIGISIGASIALALVIVMVYSGARAYAEQEIQTQRRTVRAPVENVFILVEREPETTGFGSSDMDSQTTFFHDGGGGRMNFVPQCQCGVSSEPPAYETVVEPPPMYPYTYVEEWK